jgi:SAM-dependent methyltransferase
MQAGLTARGSVTDLSPGMVAAALRNAENLGLDVDGRVADAEQIPYEGATFDVVVGHAVLHHIPDLDAAFREVLRVLKPGGRFVFAGEPTRIGDRYARLLGGLTWKATTALTRLPALSSWRRPQTELDESSRAAELEAIVDIHTFDPAALEALARGAGAADVRRHRGVHRRDARLAGADVRAAVLPGVAWPRMFATAAGCGCPAGRARPAGWYRGSGSTTRSSRARGPRSPTEPAGPAREMAA